MDPLLLGLDPGVVAGAAPAGNPANVTMNWTLFSGVYAAIDTPLVGAVDAIIGAITGQLVPVMKTLLTLYVMWVCYQAMFAPNGSPISLMVSTLVRCAVIVMLVANTGNFNQWIGTGLLTGIPNDFGQLLNGAMGGGTPISGGGQFDAIWNKSYVAGLVVYDNLPSVSLKGALLSIVVFGYWLVAIVFVSIGFLMFLGSHVLLAPIVAIGPVFVACALFETTRRFFNGWLSAVLTLLVAQLLIVTLLTLMINIETNELGKLATAPAGANEIGQLGALMGVAALLGICAVLARQIPSVAMVIAGGAYHQLNIYSGAAMAAAAGGLRGISAAGAAASGIGISSSRSIGRGLPPMAARSLSGP